MILQRKLLDLSGVTLSSQWIELSVIAHKVPRATLDSWARRDKWPHVMIRGRKHYPAHLVARRVAGWSTRKAA